MEQRETPRTDSETRTDLMPRLASEGAQGPARESDSAGTRAAGGSTRWGGAVIVVVGPNQPGRLRTLAELGAGLRGDGYWVEPWPRPGDVNSPGRESGSDGDGGPTSALRTLTQRGAVVLMALDDPHPEAVARLREAGVPTVVVRLGTGPPRPPRPVLPLIYRKVTDGRLTEHEVEPLAPLAGPDRTFGVDPGPATDVGVASRVLAVLEARREPGLRPTDLAGRDSGPGPPSLAPTRLR